MKHKTSKITDVAWILTITSMSLVVLSLVSEHFHAAMGFLYATIPCLIVAGLSMWNDFGMFDGLKREKRNY